MKQIIECRYEYISSSEGKKWTKWFKLPFVVANVTIKDLENSSKETDRITKLKHEYRILEETFE